MSEPTQAKPAELPRFFFSYRRQDASAEAGRLRDALANTLRKCYPNVSSQELDAAIFLDVVGIAAGRDFGATIDHTLGKVSVVIAVIGPRWCGAGSFWTSRIRSDTDWVRRELETAHALPVAILPVRVDGASPLRKRDLPASLHYLLRLQTPELRNERWDDDVAAFMRDVIKASELVLQNPAEFRGSATGRAAGSPEPMRRWRLPHSIALGTLLLGLGAWLFVESSLLATGTETGTAFSAATRQTAASEPAAQVPQAQQLGAFAQRPHSSGALAALAPKHDNVGVFWIASDHGIKNRYWDLSMGPSWSEQAPTFVTWPSAAATDSSVSVVARTQDDLHAFWIAPDRTIRTNRWYRLDRKNWRPDNENVGTAAVGSNVFALARELDQLDVFWVGPERDVWTSWWDSRTKRWGSRPITYPNLAAQGSSVSAVARKRGLLEVFWVDPEGAIREKRWSANADWRKHELGVVTPPRAAMDRSVITSISTSPLRLDLFWTTAAGAVKTIAWSEADEKNWLEHPITSITPDNSVRPGAQVAAVARTGDRLDLFWISTEGALQTQWRARSDKGDWDQHEVSQVLPPGSAAATSSISAVARTESDLDLFWIGNDRALRALSLVAAPGQPWVQRGPVQVIQRDSIGDGRAAQSGGRKLLFDAGAGP